MKKQKKEQRKDNLMVLVVVTIGIMISLLILGPYLVPKRNENTVKETTEITHQEFATAHAGANSIVNATMIYPSEEAKVVEEDFASSNEAETTETEIEKENGTESESEATYYSEFQDFCRLTYAESGLEQIEGQIAVAAVILNRQGNSKFPDTFEGVMNQSGAFSSVRNGEIYKMTSNPYVLDYEDIPDKTIEATQRALSGEDPTEELLWNEAVRLGLDPEEYAAGGALFFYNPQACSDEALAERANIKCKVQIGNHIFYKVWG